MTKIASVSLCSSLLLALALLPSAGLAQSVGAAAAVRPTSTGTPPGGSARTLEIGTDIVSRERIETSASGSLQVMFLDKTTLTVGPNSDLLIDEFVYNPGNGGGQFTASLAKGALRFVGGQISHNQGAVIDTPTATIGIRGGAAIVEIMQSCMSDAKSNRRNDLCTRVACTGGQCTVTAKSGNAGIIPLGIGQAVEVGNLGASPPFNASSVRLSSVTGAGEGVEEGEEDTPENGASTSLLIQNLNDEVPQQEAEPPPPPPPGGGGEPPPPPP